MPRPQSPPAPAPPAAAVSPPPGGAHDGSRPLLLVDIDGVISLFGFEHEQPPDGAFHSIDGIVHFLSATAGGHLHELLDEFETVWCSGWEEKANEYLPHLLGLPRPLPYLSFDRSPGRGNAHWKLAAIDAYAFQRPLAWLDDAFNQACHDWAGARAAPTLLLATRAGEGLTGEHVLALRRWAASPEVSDACASSSSS